MQRHRTKKAWCVQVTRRNSLWPENRVGGLRIKMILKPLDLHFQNCGSLLTRRSCKCFPKLEKGRWRQRVMECFEEYFRTWELEVEVGTESRGVKDNSLFLV